MQIANQVDFLIDKENDSEILKSNGQENDSKTLSKLDNEKDDNEDQRNGIG